MDAENEKKMEYLVLIKGGKSLQAMSWKITCSKMRFGETSFLKNHCVIMEDGYPVDKIGKVFYRYDPQIIDLFLQVLRLTTEMMSLFVEDVFEHYPAVILRYEMLEGLVDKGYSGEEDGIGYGLSKCLVHDNIGLEVFVME